MASEGESITERILRCVEQADWEGLADCYARDVLLDPEAPHQRRTR